MQDHHSLPICVCLALAAILLAGFQNSVQADTQIFPVPSVSTSKNDGNDAGLIAPILISDPDGELKYLMAPMLIQNSIVGTRAVFNLFKYDPGGRQMRFIASLTERIERKVLFDYVDPAFGNGQYSLNFGGTFLKMRPRDSSVWGNRRFRPMRRTIPPEKPAPIGASASMPTRSLRCRSASVFARFNSNEALRIFPFQSNNFPRSMAFMGSPSLSGIGHRSTMTRAIVWSLPPPA